jgi:hypothetical protein
MDVSELLIELYGRIPPLAERAVDGLSPDQLRRTVVDDTNPIGWLVWHLARVQDHHVAELIDGDQIWAGGDWATRFSLTPDPANIGYGHTPAEVAAVRPDGPRSLLDYLDAVQTRTVGLLESLDPAQLDRIVDRRWDPPVSMGVRLVSIADDSLQHVGQACYLRGLLGWCGGHHGRGAPRRFGSSHREAPAVGWHGPPPPAEEALLLASAPRRASFSVACELPTS